MDGSLFTSVNYIKPTGYTFSGPLHNTNMKVANPKVVINVIISTAWEDRVVLGLLMKIGTSCAVHLFYIRVNLQS